MGLPRTKPPDERKADLVAAAAKVFERKGYSKATVSEIVKEAGVAQGTFYIYFHSKEEALDAVAEHILKDIIIILVSISRSDRTAIEKVQELLKTWFELGTTPGPLLEELHDSEYAPLHDRMAHMAVKKMLPPMIEIIEQGVAEGTMDVLYPEVTAMNWVSVDFPTEVILATISVKFVQMVEAYADFVRRLLGIEDRHVFDGLVAQARRKARSEGKKKKKTR
jgi:AcrR family transcriptional regulator